MIHRTAFVAFLGFLLAVGIALGQTEIKLDDPQATYTHLMGFAFPSEVNGMPRIGLTRYDDGGKDISASYNHPSPKITATVYVYPAAVPHSKLESYLKEIAEYLAEAPGMKLLKIEAATIALGEKKLAGFRALFSVNEPHSLAAAVKGSALSEFYLFPLEGNWHLKFRITYLVQDKEQAAPIIEKFINSFALPDEKK